MRKTELDLCRIFGCLAVLMIHAGADIYHELPLEGFSFAAVNFLSTAGRRERVYFPPFPAAWVCRRFSRSFVQPV